VSNVRADAASSRPVWGLAQTAGERDIW